MIKILVPSQEEKERLIAASEDLHYSNMDISSPGMNLLAHIYMMPQLI